MPKGKVTPDPSRWALQNISMPRNLQDLVELQKKVIIAVTQNEIKASQANAVASMMRVLVPLVKEAIKNMGNIEEMDDAELVDLVVNEFEEKDLLVMALDKIKQRLGNG